MHMHSRSVHIQGRYVSIHPYIMTVTSFFAYHIVHTSCSMFKYNIYEMHVDAYAL